ncbi:50S ribosomal protein L5 [Patescibacteria group bacterium]|nr:50S ribosomal protein L5 [Patescibacteria group bacterium]
MNRLKQRYQTEVVPQLTKELGIKNAFSVPKLEKVVLNMGVVDMPQNPRARMAIIENVVEQFQVITGQHPQITKAKKSIAGFKLREGEPLGVMVTLRGERMWEFVDKLISTALPRVRDFTGISRTAFDGHGNYNLGISEQIVFPEIVFDSIESVRGLQITFVTNTNSNEQSFALLKALGMPFAKEEVKE